MFGKKCLNEWAENDILLSKDRMTFLKMFLVDLKVSFKVFLSHLTQSQAISRNHPETILIDVWTSPIEMCEHDNKILCNMNILSVGNTTGNV